ncbi:MAG: class I SAM-dependent methyltransferase, partial [Erysipelotrichaceae bacterium]|nr:class I SAM-dependent methyltransferase [Erysipelotrichaceae bacterium]
VSSITGIDISSGMIEAAKRNCLSEKIVLIGDEASEQLVEKSYDRIVVFYAFPHFTDPDRMMQNLSEHLSKGGTLTIAHDSSREEINRRHNMMRKNVSHVLMGIDELESIVSEYLTVTYKRSDDRIYQIVGRKQKES